MIQGKIEKKSIKSKSIFVDLEFLRRVSVVRGRVLTPAGEGLRGVRVSPLSSTSGAGFTLTRTDGWFDIMINGGGVVTLKFGKSPFIYQSKSISVPWNQVSVQYSVQFDP